MIKRKQKKQTEPEVKRVLKRGCMYCSNAQNGQIGTFFIKCCCPIDGSYVISMDESVIDAGELAICPYFMRKEEKQNRHRI